MIKSRFLPLNVVASLIFKLKSCGSVIQDAKTLLKTSDEWMSARGLFCVKLLDLTPKNHLVAVAKHLWLKKFAHIVLNLQDFRKGKTWKIIWQFFCLVVCVFRKLKPWDPVVRTHVTPFLINSLKIWHLTRKSSSGVKSSLCKFAWNNFLIHQEHAPKLVSSTSLWMILQFIG